MSRGHLRPGTVGILFGYEEDVFCSVARSMCPDSVLVTIRLGSRPLVSESVLPNAGSKSRPRGFSFLVTTGRTVRVKDALFVQVEKDDARCCLDIL